MITVQDRISMLAVHAGNKSLKALARDLGINPQVFYDIMSGKTLRISARVADKIFLAFPDVNKDWVLNGEGEMLSRPTPKLSDPVTISGDLLQIYLNLSETARLQQETIRDLIRMQMGDQDITK